MDSLRLAISGDRDAEIEEEVGCAPVYFSHVSILVF